MTINAPYEKKENSQKQIRGYTHRATYISAANYFMEPLLKPNTCQSIVLLPNCPLCKFQTFQLINSNKILEIRANYRKINEVYLQNNANASC